MNFFECLGMFLFYCFDLEIVYGLVIKFLQLGVVIFSGLVMLFWLCMNVVGLDVVNLLGLVVGFDKNVEVLLGLLWVGFGFFEVGVVMF